MDDGGSGPQAAFGRKSTSRHIFEKVIICIERGLFSVYFKEMNLFKILFFEKGVLFLPAS